MTDRELLEFAHEWYGCRWERLRALIRERAPEIEAAACCVMANGTADVDEPPTYAQQMNALRHENARLRAAVGAALALLRGWPDEVHDFVTPGRPLLPLGEVRRLLEAGLGEGVGGG